MRIRVTPDPQRARALLLSADQTWQRLRESDVTKYPSDTLNDYYDIIHKHLDAIGALDGVRFKNDGAHAELINNICATHKINEATRLFLQELREFRNRSHYDGLAITAEYIISNTKRIELVIEMLKNIYRGA